MSRPACGSCPFDPRCNDCPYAMLCAVCLTRPTTPDQGPVCVTCCDPVAMLPGMGPHSRTDPQMACKMAEKVPASGQAPGTRPTKKESI